MLRSSSFPQQIKALSVSTTLVSHFQVLLNPQYPDDGLIHRGHFHDPSMSSSSNMLNVQDISATFPTVSV